MRKFLNNKNIPIAAGSVLISTLFVEKCSIGRYSSCDTPYSVEKLHPNNSTIVSFTYPANNPTEVGLEYATY